MFYDKFRTTSSIRSYINVINIMYECMIGWWAGSRGSVLCVFKRAVLREKETKIR